MPSVGQDDFETSPEPAERADPAGQGRRGRPGVVLAKGGPPSADNLDSSQVVSPDARYTRKRRAASDGTSSVIMVAGAGFEPATFGL